MLDGGEDALVERQPVGQVARDLRGRRRASTSVASGLRPMKDQRLQRSPCSTDSSRKPGLVVTAQPGEGGDRRGQVGEQLAPHRDDRVLGASRELVAEVALGQALVGVPPSADRLEASAPKARKKQEYSPVWQAPLPSCSTTNSSVSPSQS